MSTGGWEFTGSASSARLRMSAEPRPQKRTGGVRRQSRCLIVYAALRALPGCASLLSFVWLTLRRFVPGISEHTRLAGSLTGLAALLLAIFWGLAVWMRDDWELTADRIRVSKGIFLRRESLISKKAILSVESERTLLFGIMGCRRVTIRTAGRQPDQLLLTEPAASMLAARLVPSHPGSCRSYRAPAAALWLAALGGEGFAAFCSAVAPLSSLLWDIVITPLQAQFALITDGSYLALAAAGAWSVLWIFKVIHSRISAAKTSFSLSDGRLMLCRGIVTLRTDTVSAFRICAVEARSSVLGFLLKRQSCSVLTPGERRYPLLPPESSRRLRVETATLFPHGNRICSVRPLSLGMSYASGRWLVCVLTLPALSIFRGLFPALSVTVPVVGLTAALLLAWRALASTISSGRAGLTQFTDSIELTGIKGLSIRTLRVFRPSVGVIKITQSPLSRQLSRCSLRIVPHGSRRAALKCVKLPFERTVSVCERMM